MNKTEFIESYIKKLEDILQQYHASKVNEDAVFDCIQEIRNVFIREIPEIEDAIWLKDGTAEKEANSVIGILRLRIIDSEKSTKISDIEQIEKSLRELRIEFNGIKNTIVDYTSDGNIINYLDQLDKAIYSGSVVKT